MAIAVLIVALAAAPTKAQTPGALDTAFDGDGRVEHKLVAASSDDAVAIVGYPGERYVMASRCYNVSNQPIVCVARLNENGALDTSFATSGIFAAQPISGYTMFANAVAVQSDGKIVVAGECRLGGSGATLSCHARLLANGTLDSSYGASGSVVVSFVNYISSKATGVAIQADGKIVVGGNCSDTSGALCVWRYLANGTFDTAYGSNGLARATLTTGSFSAVSLLLASDNSATLVGYCDYSGTGFANACLVRFTPAGVRDTAYVGGSGAPILAHHASGAAYEVPRAAVLQADGRVVLAGSCILDGALRACAARVTTGGALDSSFAGGWSVPTNVALGAENFAGGIALERDGKLVLSANCVDRYKVCALRLNSDGALDTAYGTGGVKAVTTGGFAVNVNGAYADSKKRLLIAGGCFGNDGGGITDSCAFRLLPGPGAAARACSFDVDGDSVSLSVNDQLLMTRAALGFSGSGVTAGVTFAGSAKRTTWPLIRDYLFVQCGLSILP
jgi:uncharacterized delta-60 repeat protein